MSEELVVTTKQEQYIEKEVTFAELAAMIGVDDLDSPEVYDIEDEGIQILSTDPDTKEDVWKSIQNFVVKRNQDFHYNLHGLKGTHEHMVLFNDQWTMLKDHPEAVRVEEGIQVVDLTVADTHTYQCAGQINHNTVTPGGMSLPYSCSTRIRITSTGQNVLKNKNGDVYGVLVKAKTIKNKVARPFRSVEFEIHFGRGVREHEQVFDLFREHCSKTKDGVRAGSMLINVEGVGAWKTFTVSNAETGEVETEIKFHKPEFGTKVLYAPEYSSYMDALYEAALVVKPDEEIKQHSTFDSASAASNPDADA